MKNRFLKTEETPKKETRPAKQTRTKPSKRFGGDTSQPFQSERNPNRKTERLQRAIFFNKKYTHGNTEEDPVQESKVVNKLLKRTSGKKAAPLAAKKTTPPKNTTSAKKASPARQDDTVRLNKYLANAGVAARRKCDELIAQGHVKVNGQVVTEMGYRLKKEDKVTYKGKVVKPVNHVYLLLNKPKDYITTVEDERGRNTVMELIAGATQERVYPVGRLDRNTTGLLLLTNDGELAQKLSHPSYGAQKIYEVELDKPVKPADLLAIGNGVELEDGLAVVDGIDYAHPVKKNVVGISLHVGKNRIVRRIFEHLGYDVIRLDRTFYAGLTKRDLPRGRWRHLTEREIIKLKYLK